MKSKAWEKVEPPMRSCDWDGGRKKGRLTNTVSMMCKWPMGMKDVSKHKQLFYKKEQRQKKCVGTSGEEIGYEGCHKVVIWHDNGEIIMLKIETNDKYYTF